MCPTRTFQKCYINDSIWLIDVLWALNVYVEYTYNSTGVYRPPGSGCSTPRTVPASVPAYTSVGSAEVRHGSSYTGHRIPWGGQLDVKMRGWPLGQYSYLVLSPHILRQPSHWLHWLHEPRQIWHWGDLGQTLTCFMSGTRRNLLTYEEGHQGTLCGRREGVISDEADCLLHYCPLEDGLEVWWEAGPWPAEEDQEEHRPGGGGHHGQTWVRGTSSDVTLTLARHWIRSPTHQELLLRNTLT